jgi:hypothetical protein
LKLRGSGSHSAAAVNTLARLTAVQEGQAEPRARQAIDYERALPPRLAVQPEPRTAPAFETDVVHRPPDVDSPRSTRPRSLLSDQLQIGTAGYATHLERRSSRPALRLPSSPTSPTWRPAGVARVSITEESPDPIPYAHKLYREPSMSTLSPGPSAMARPAAEPSPPPRRTSSFASSLSSSSRGGGGGSSSHSATALSRQAARLGIVTSYRDLNLHSAAAKGNVGEFVGAVKTSPGSNHLTLTRSPPPIQPRPGAICAGERPTRQLGPRRRLADPRRRLVRERDRRPHARRSRCRRQQSALVAQVHARRDQVEWPVGRNAR